MSAVFPAPTIPYPPSSSDDSDHHSRRPHTSGSRRSHRPAKLSLASGPPIASRVHPPTPSLISSPGNDTGRSDRRKIGRKPQRSRSTRNRSAAGTGDAAAWSGFASESEAGELEMESYSTAEDEETGLTSAGGRRTRRQARRGARPRDGGEADYDALLGADGRRVALTKEEKKHADTQVVRNLAINVILIGLWYLFSLLISIYNKWMFSPDHLNFHFPLFVTCTHMLVQFSLSSLVLFALPQFRPAGFFGAKIPEGTGPLAPNGDEDIGREGLFHFNSRAEEKRKRQLGIMTKWTYLTKVGPCGAATGLDIGLGNMSLKFITLAFYTMCKSSSLAFVLLFAFLFGLEKVTWKLAAIIAIMTLGVVMMVASEAKFIMTGFVLVIVASALSGLRWSLTQMLLLKNPATSNPFSSIFFLAPCMFVAIFVIAVPVEGFGALVAGFGELVHNQGFLPAVAIILFPGIIAFLMVSSEFALLRRSSVVTLSICGIFKEVVTISAAAIIFKDPLTPINISGLCVTIVSIGAYNYIKIQKMRREAAEQAAAESSVGGYDAVSEGDSDNDDEDARTEDELVSPAKSTDMGAGGLGSEVRFGESAISPGVRHSLEPQSSESSSDPKRESSKKLQDTPDLL